ncbi:Imm10 family immunity protein [Neolewinella xylanilytica]|uniref:Imm10 family immunity protein n=1 Tax=Neolewinella xylanilytica TaxID=1514080 RepID=UPI000CEADDA0|nr:Imm10 family immunity protein [Neolewinella xylanilytica]
MSLVKTPEFSFTAYNIQASDIEEDEYYLISYADDGVDPENYIIIQCAYTFDDMDKKQGIDSAYFESSFVQIKGYFVIDQWVTRQMSTEITITSKSTMKMYKFIIEHNFESLPSNYEEVVKQILANNQ